MAPECRKWYAFWTPEGLFEPIAIPFRAAEVPTWYQAVIGQLFEHLDYVRNSIDDILVEGNNEEQLFEHLWVVLKILQRHNLRVNPFKSEFFMQHLTWLGRIISEKEISNDPECIKGALALAPPTNMAEYHSYRGGVQWLAPFIPALAQFIRTWMTSSGRGYHGVCRNRT